MAVYTRKKIHSSSTMVLVLMVVFCILQCVVAQKSSSAKLKGSESLENRYFQCKGDLRALEKQNLLYDKKIKKRDIRILGFLKNKKTLSDCNDKFSTLLASTNNTKGAEKCPVEGLQSQIKKITSNIVHELDEQKDSQLKRYKELIDEMKEFAYLHMMARNNVEYKLSEYDCSVIKERERRIAAQISRVIEQKKWSVDRFKKLKDEQLGIECKLKRHYFLFRDLVPWHEAMFLCAKRRMTFATVKNKEENNELHEVVKGPGRAWVGGVLYEGKWTWQDEPFSYTNWGQEDRVKKTANEKKCMQVLGATGLWENVHCNEELYYVCQSSGDF